jgi:hypothetical protein
MRNPAFDLHSGLYGAGREDFEHEEAKVTEDQEDGADGPVFKEADGYGAGTISPGRIDQK